jgi:hypothetical protein
MALKANIDGAQRVGTTRPTGGVRALDRRRLGFGPVSGAGAQFAPHTVAVVPVDGENTAVDLARIGWLATVLACMIAVLILLLQGYYGYAGVTFAVAASAAINLR